MIESVPAGSEPADSQLRTIPSLKAVLECVPYSSAAVLNREGRYLLIGGSLWREIGIDPESQLKDRLLRDLWDETTAEALHALLDRAIDEDSSEGWVPWGGRSYHVVMTRIDDPGLEEPCALLLARDATEQLETEQLFRELVQNVPVAVHATDSEGLTNVWNPAAERVFGIARADALGVAPGVLLDRLGVPADARVRRAVAGGGAWDGDVAVVRPDAERRIVTVIHRALPDDHSEGFRAVSIALDVTRQRLEQQVRERRRLESLGRVAGGVAHDFGNLLTAMMGRVEFLEDIVEDPRAREEFQGMRDALESAGQLTSKLLSFGEDSDGPRTCSPAVAAARVESLMHRLLPDEIDMRVEVESQARVPLSATDFEQLLLNLASNAADAMPEGGRLVVSIGEEGEDVVVTVADEGGGIPADVREELFSPFVTTKVPGRGTGLGLATVHSIASAAGGAAMVRETGPSGTVMSVRLPVATPDEAEPSGTSGDG